MGDMMALHAPSSGLRQFHNKSNDVAKISIVVPAGDAIAVSDAVASQLGSAFAEKGVEPDKPVPVSAESTPTPAPKAPAKKVAAKRVAAKPKG